MKMATAKLQSVLHSGDGEPIGAFVADAAARALISEAGVARGWPAQAVQNGDLATATEYTAEVNSPRILLVELLSSEQGVSGIAALKDELKPEVMRVVFKDSGFADDVIKTNAAEILKQAGIDDVKSL